MQSRNQVSQILRSLVPSCQEEVPLLRSLLACAQSVYRKAHSDLGVRSNVDDANVASVRMVGINADLEMQRILASIPSESKRYFDGLVEAMEVYHSIYGKPVPIHRMSERDSIVLELKKIRDQCLHEGLRSIY